MRRTSKQATLPSLLNQNTLINLYHNVKKQYEGYFSKFQSKINSVCQKENYRIYLQSRAVNKAYNKLLKQKEELNRQIQIQRHKKNDANKTLAQEIKRLETLNVEYEEIRTKYANMLKKSQLDIEQKKQVSREAQERVKNTWKNLHPTQFTSLASSSVQKNSLMSGRIYSQASQSLVRLPSIYSYLKQNKIESENSNQAKLNRKRSEQYRSLLGKQKQKMGIMRLFISYLRRNHIDLREKAQQSSIVAQKFKNMDMPNLLQNLQEGLAAKQNIIVQMQRQLDGDRKFPAVA